jgi:hypothetical protein
MVLVVEIPCCPALSQRHLLLIEQVHVVAVPHEPLSGAQVGRMLRVGWTRPQRFTRIRMQLII